MPYANIEDQRANARRYRERHAVECAARTKAWKQAHQERARELNRNWEAANPEKIAAYRKTERFLELKRASGKRSYLVMSEQVRKTRMICSARNNAKKKGLQFSLAATDLVWPEVCPVLGIKLNYKTPTNGRLSYDSPSLDRTDPKQGYVKGNVVVMSWRANRIKTDATNEELFKLAEYVRKTRSN